jgi:DNA-binding HxlR family transcriptional regulator
MTNTDELILKLLKASKDGFRFSQMKKVLGHTIPDKTLATSLRRLARYGDIRKVLYFDGQRPKVIYRAVEEGNKVVEIWLRREVYLEDGTRAYYDVFLDWAGDRVDHELTIY